MSKESEIAIDYARKLALLSIKNHEGFRQFPYKDTTGHLTIGYGRNLDTVGIIRDEAHTLVVSDIQYASRELQNYCAEVVGLDQVRTAVCIELVFNLGLHGYMLFKKMRQAIARGDFEEAALEALDSRWADQVGQRARVLAKQLLTGVCQFEA